MASNRRSQAQNRELAFRRLALRLHRLNQVSKPRVPTKVPSAQNEARLRAKRHLSAIKARRGIVRDDSTWAS